MIFEQTLRDDLDAQEEVRRWIEALRSGNWLQGKGALKAPLDDDGMNDGAGKGVGFCCLGVYCDIADPTGWDASAFDDDGKVGYEHKFSASDEQGRVLVDRGNLYYLNSDGSRRLHLTPSGQEVLGTMNDGKGFGKPPSSFGEIADFIESELAEALL